MDPISASIALLKSKSKYSFWILLSLAIGDSLTIHIFNLGETLPKEWAASLRPLEIFLWTGVVIFGIVLYRSIQQANKKMSVTFPMPHTHFWHEAKQSNGEIFTQISANVLVKNLSDRPLGLSSVKLVRPGIAGAVLDGRALIKEKDSPYSSTTMVSGYKIEPFDSRPVSLSLLIGASIGRANGRQKDIEATLTLIDEDGFETDITTIFNIH